MKFYITTSIAYANASPHIGFALESIQADVLARYHRINGDEVFFLTGTDEYGTKIFQAAQKANSQPREFVDKISEDFKNLKKVLNLSWDDFIRTTDNERHWPAVHKMWELLKKDIEKRSYKGLYCVGCEAFVTEKDLIDGKCPIHLKEPEAVEEKNYFFKLSKYQNQIDELIERDKIKIIPEVRKNEILSFVRQGLKDISISRPKEKLSWGIPVPEDDNQVIYVWIDALTNYISALGFGGENEEKFKKFWPADVHLIGKDILRFHAVIWIGMLLSAGLDLPKNIFVHGYITSNGQKMSKSLGNVVSPIGLVDKYGTDAVRYFLLREIPSAGDGDFTEEKFLARYNGDLANGLGNFAARVLTMASRIKLDAPSEELLKKYEQIKNQHDSHIEEFRFNEFLSAVWSLIAGSDAMINDKKPWENPEEKKDVMIELILRLRIVAEQLRPFLPETSEKILTAIKENKKPENLFPRI